MAISAHFSPGIAAVISAIVTVMGDHMGIEQNPRIIANVIRLRRIAAMRWSSAVVPGATPLAIIVPNSPMALRFSSMPNSAAPKVSTKYRRPGG